MKKIAFVFSAFFAACVAGAIEIAEPRNVPPLFPAGDWVPGAKTWHDDWAGPYGEYCTARYASPALKHVFGKKGLVSSGFMVIMRGNT